MTNEELLEMCSRKMKGISENVLGDDRKEAMEVLEVGYWTIHRYLKGDVKNLDLGVKMYEFFQNKIDNRKRVLTA